MVDKEPLCCVCLIPTDCQRGSGPQGPIYICGYCDAFLVKGKWPPDYQDSELPAFGQILTVEEFYTLGPFLV
jgi:hypothetical protein